MNTLVYYGPAIMGLIAFFGLIGLFGYLCYEASKDAHQPGARWHDR